MIGRVNAVPQVAALFALAMGGLFSADLRPVFPARCL